MFVRNSCPWDYFRIKKVCRVRLGAAETMQEISGRRSKYMNREYKRDSEMSERKHGESA